MHSACRSLEYVNYLGFFSGKNLNEIYFFKKKALLVTENQNRLEINLLPEIRKSDEQNMCCLKHSSIVFPVFNAGKN